MENINEKCTHNCATCQAACDSNGNKIPSVFDKMEEFSEKTDKFSDEQLLQMLNDFTKALEEE